MSDTTATAAFGLGGGQYTIANIVFSGLALVVLLYFLNTLYVAYLGPLSKFPGPPLRAYTTIPLIHTLFTGLDPQVYPALHRKYGPIVRIAPNQLSFNGGAQPWNEIYGFRKPGSGKPFKDPSFYGKAFNGVDGPITANDENHSRQRKILSHAFSDKALKEQEPLLKRWAEKMRDRMSQQADAGQKVDVLKMLNCTTFDIMGDLSFAEGLNMLDEGEYSPWVKTIFGSIKQATFVRGIKIYNAFTEYMVSEFLGKSKYARDKGAAHFGYCIERVNRRLEREPDRPDLWSRILEKSPLGSEGGLSLDEHHSIASLFMVAGTETTATALSGTTFHLLKNPDILANLTAEIRTAFGSLQDMHLENLAKQKYLMAVLQEGLRMYPPVPIALPRRSPAGGMMVEGEFIPAGTSIAVHQYSTYNDESHFKHAGEFHPERWLGDPEFKDDHLNALEAFSVGPRNCLGKSE
ncbi:hypothetical protein LTR62_008336 [Meristemomyces frigidus]|uniref:Cytochrome P450 monooxygenase n=1 Tax=Meristemomyces frigidus TaxID=1508187 RepID=A0AAN7TKW8_9PEZI|nr:hypothetical protein LTR62_008336 [Meristemomyces frigidus]